MVKIRCKSICQSCPQWAMPTTCVWIEKRSGPKTELQGAIVFRGQEENSASKGNLGTGRERVRVLCLMNKFFNKKEMINCVRSC